MAWLSRPEVFEDLAADASSDEQVAHARAEAQRSRAELEESRRNGRSSTPSRRFKLLPAGRGSQRPFGRHRLDWRWKFGTPHANAASGEAVA